MKQYKKDMGKHFYITKGYKYYRINNKYDGYYIFIFRDIIFSKGYFNMDMEYGYWKEYTNSLKYYL